MAIQIVEVGPRDGLQNEAVTLSVESRVKLIRGLESAGLKRIEIGAFVSPKWVPQMAGSEKVARLVLARPQPKVRYAALVPNERGMLDAIESGVREVAVFAAASESFSQKNINCSIQESFQRFEAVIQLARKNKMKVRGYLSTAFGCPYEGKVKPSRVVQLIERMAELGVFEISVGDTIGVGTPKQVHQLVKAAVRAVGAKKLAMHFHDTRGTALANVLASLDHGVQVFDASFGGLGGCPYAKGASGNLATEDLVYMLEGMGLKTGVSLPSLFQLKGPIEADLNKRLPGRAIQAGPTPVA